MIKPIETVYNGYRFRSRLEARWAVYFDTAGVRYEYELQGYDLRGDAGCYLPDFWLPDIKVWAEVKAREFTAVEHNKCHLLSKGTGCPVLKLSGTPALGDGVIQVQLPPNLSAEEEADILRPIYDIFQSETVDDAISAARQARFEHGETP